MIRMLAVSAIRVYLVLAVALGGLAGCFGGKDVDLTCDEVRRYQRAVAGTRLETPDDLDALEQRKEIPLPEASPRPPREPGSPCLDLPPGLLGGADRE